MSKNNPPIPRGWDKTVDDLVAEMRGGERESISGPEIMWAREYERSLIPAGVRFPRRGDVYEALHEFTVQYLTAWKAPYTGSGEGLIKKGDRFVVNQDPSGPEPIAVCVRARNYDEVEQRIVPQSDHQHPKYDGFYFVFKTQLLNDQFRLVNED